MRKLLLLTLIPLVLPLAAQGQTAPHFYTGTPGTLAPAGKVINAIGAGTLELTNYRTGKVTCRTLGGGDVSNPVGGGQGRDNIASFSAYECVSEQCAAQGGSLEATFDNLRYSKWAGVLNEYGPTQSRLKVSGVEITLTCFAKSGTVVTTVSGTMDPLWQNVEGGLSSLIFDHESNRIGGGLGGFGWTEVSGTVYVETETGEALTAH